MISLRLSQHSQVCSVSTLLQFVASETDTHTHTPKALMDMASLSRLRLPFSLFLFSSVFISLVSVSRSFACSLKPSQTLTISHSIKSKPFPQIQSSKPPFLQLETLSQTVLVSICLTKQNPRASFKISNPRASFSSDQKKDNLFLFRFIFKIKRFFSLAFLSFNKFLYFLFINQLIEPSNKHQALKLFFVFFILFFII